MTDSRKDAFLTQATIEVAVGQQLTILIVGTKGHRVACYRLHGVLSDSISALLKARLPNTWSTHSAAMLSRVEYAETVLLNTQHCLDKIAM